MECHTEAVGARGGVDVPAEQGSAFAQTHKAVAAARQIVVR